MDSSKSNKIIYDKNVLSFVAASVKFCQILESDEEVSREIWVADMLKILPLLYVKGLMLPDGLEMVNEEFPPLYVREEDYSRVATRVAQIMSEEDTYLDVFVEEMKYSDRPISAFVSENIADIYQDIRNFVSIYQFELTNQMQDALVICRQNFLLYWGQKLVNVLRPLHALMCRNNETGMDVRTDNLNIEGVWD